MNKTNTGCIAAALLFLAQSPLVTAEIAATVDAKAVYDDNIYGQQNNEVDSWMEVVRPGLKLETKQGASKYAVALNAESGTVQGSKSGDDDYTDYGIGASGNWRLNESNVVELALNAVSSHDKRGGGRMDVAAKSGGPGAWNTFVAANDAREVDTFQKDSVSAEYRLGAKDSKGRLVLNGSYTHLDYTNHTSFTSAQDREDTALKGVGYFVVAPRTSALLEVRSTAIDYRVDAPTNKDSQELRYFVGVSWEATAKTSGSMRFGYQEKNPDSSRVKDYEDNAWEVDVVWKPKSYSSLSVTAIRGVAESSTLIYLDSTLLSLNWKHEWSKVLSTNIYASRDQQEYLGGPSREDDVDTFGISADYKLQKWITLVTDYRYTARDSSTAGLDYNENIVSLGAEAAFR